MSSYFDERAQVIRELADRYEEDADFLSEVISIERDAFQAISMNTGDREFPGDLRERIMGVFAVHTVSSLCIPGQELWRVKPVQAVLRTRRSVVLDEVHDLFHEVARRRIQTRFGVLSDSPSQNLKLRDEYDAEQALKLISENTETDR